MNTNTEVLSCNTEENKQATKACQVSARNTLVFHWQSTQFK